MTLPHSSGPITSLKNPRLRAAVDLRDRRSRDATGLTLVDGVRELGRAVAGGAEIVEVFVDPASLPEAGLAAVEAAIAAGATRIEVSGTALTRLAYGDRAEGVVATVRVPDMALESLPLPENPLIAVLEAVEKPGNLGAVLRTADGAGADAVIAAAARTDLFNPNAVRASLGTIFAVPLAAGSSEQVRDYLLAAGIRLVAARVDAEIEYTVADLTGPVAIVLGNEVGGLSGAWDHAGVLPVRLPMLGIADSLNVSTAAAILLYEARRQRGTPL